MKRIQILLFLIGLCALGLIILLGLRDITHLFQGKASYTINTSSAAVVKQMQSLKRLETASFTIEKIIDAGTTGNVFQEFLFGDKILLIAHGQVIAGIDFSRMQTQDIHPKGNTIALTLPAPEIFFTTLDSDKTRVYDRKLGVLSRPNKDLEAQARLRAQEEIQKAACSEEILQTASTNARQQTTAFLRALGFSNISITIPVGTCE